MEAELNTNTSETPCPLEVTYVDYLNLLPNLDLTRELLDLYRACNRDAEMLPFGLSQDIRKGLALEVYMYRAVKRREIEDEKEMCNQSEMKTIIATIRDVASCLPLEELAYCLRLHFYLKEKEPDSDLSVVQNMLSELVLRAKISEGEALR
ncbi:hypothetical protein [Roseibium sp. RKSG952]|uniref:hypothetical protein n=1 Tax=Roseibium sp. RKSG952 TaxID=2529384 RepID=UPI0012BB65CD|nr:hypothetical protein [Roseibium sp. RKSG952]MTI03699.1 hypothetical protein [Roseibium sp. RKSG952]